MTRTSLFERETLVFLTHASNIIHGNPSTQTLWRWASSRGYQGIRLETCKIGGRRVTSHEAIARFNERVNAADPLSNVTPSEAALAADGI